MATQQVTFCTSKKLDCCIGTTVILCVPASLVLSGFGFIEATFLSGGCPQSTCCGPTYSYTFSYDVSQLVDPETPLTTVDIRGAFCTDCFTNWISNGPSNGDILGSVNFYQVEAPTVMTAELAGLGAGNLPNGPYTYKVTFVTDEGETELGYHIPFASVTVVDNTVDGQVLLSDIQLGPFGSGVTARKLYRNLSGNSEWYYLDTVNDNTTTTYVDNIAAISTSDIATFRPNTTMKFYLHTSLGLVRVMGYPGVQNTSWGVDTLASITTGYWNVVFGEGALTDCTIGHENTALGLDSMNRLVDGVSNTGVGIDSLYNVLSGIGNTSVGAYSFLSLVTGDFNVGLGRSAGNQQTAGSRNIVIGANADLPSLTGSDQLSIANFIYGDTALGKIGVGVSAPGAALEIKAGTTTIGPLKLNSGTNLTVPVNGTFEFNGTDLFFTVGGVRKTVTLV